MRRTCKNSTVEFMLICRSLPPNLTHGGSGPATSPCRRGERKRRRRKNFLVLLVLAVNVPVLDSDKFQQSKLYIQFIDRVLGIPVMRAETCTHSANCAEDRRSCRCCSWTVSPPGIGGVSSVRHPTLTRSTLSTSSVCHPSVAASRCCVVVDFALLTVLTILFETG